MVKFFPKMSSSKGFTLVELLTVVAMILILSLISLYAVAQVKEKAMVTMIKHDLKNVLDKEFLFYSTENYYCGTEGDVYSADPEIPNNIVDPDYRCTFDDLSEYVVIRVIEDDPSIVVTGEYRGTDRVFKCDIETGEITEL